MNKNRIFFAFDYIFPTFILPNATMTEIGIANYLMSLYSNRAKDCTFFEHGFGERGLTVSDFFDNSIGGSSNTGTGFFYQASSYTNKFDYREDSLFRINKSGQNFIYPVKSSPQFSNFIGLGNGVPDKVQGNYFWKYMSKEALELVRRKKGKIFIDYSMEPFIDKYMHDDFHSTLKFSGIDKDSIIMCVNSFNAKECYESWYTEAERRYKVVNLPFCLEYTSWFFDTRLKEGHKISMSEEDFINSKNVIRNNHFLMKMRNIRHHRLPLFFKMISDNLLNLGDWSFLSTDNLITEDTIKHIIWQYKLSDINIDSINDILNSAPHLLQSEENANFDIVNAWTDEHFSPYINSYFEICQESFVHGEHKSLTEKIFKPIANYQPFLFVAYPGALKLLRELGFKTFDGFIDESYDGITDISEKLSKIYSEIKRLCNMSKEELHNWYWSMEDILVYNRNLLLEYHKKRSYGEELMNEFGGIPMPQTITKEIL